MSYPVSWEGGGEGRGGEGAPSGRRRGERRCSLREGEGGGRKGEGAPLGRGRRRCSLREGEEEVFP